MTRLNNVLRAVAAASLLIGFAAATDAREAAPPRVGVHTPAPWTVSPPAESGARMVTSVALDTFVVGEWTFDTAGVPDMQGWTLIDATADEDTFFHVSDITELDGGDQGRLVVLEGNQSMWCGVTSSDPVGCGYATAPGYGNGWNQTLTSKSFSRSGDVVVTFLAAWDAEPGYDGTSLEYLDQYGDWIRLGSNNQFTFEFSGAGFQTFVVPDTAMGPEVRLRFHFTSDGAFSDEEGLFPTDGAFIVDSLMLVDATGTLSFNDFEAEPFGVHATNDGHWQAERGGGFGLYGDLFPGNTVVQEDGCAYNASALWGFFSGSTETYACGGYPGQPAVPKGTPNTAVYNRIVSPVIDFTQDIHGAPVPPASSTAIFEFDVYRDLPLDNAVFYEWWVRPYDNGCAAQWRNDNFVHYGSGKDWYRHKAQIGKWIPPGTQEIQVALAVRDMCPNWCGIYSTGACHSHAPLFDNVRVTRVDLVGPSWSMLDFEPFQDTFAEDGTTTGTCRMDAASGTDHARAYVTTNLLIDDHIPGDPFSGDAVYFHVKDILPGKTGAVVSSMPYVGTADGWSVFQAERQSAIYGLTEFQLNDALYTPGDTVCYYYSARDTSGNTTYFSAEVGTVGDEAIVRSRPMEATCLPTGDSNILYVDRADGLGPQPFFDTAFQMLGLTPDRYDIHNPYAGDDSSPGNFPGEAVTDVAAQLVSSYDAIVWGAGSIESRTIEDFQLLYDFLSLHTGNAGVFLNGDNIAADWDTHADAAATDLRTDFMNFALVGDDHTSLGLGTAPLLVGEAGSIFDHGGGNVDSLLAFAGDCSGINAFDVLGAGAGASVAMTYPNGQGAVVVQETNNVSGGTARVALSGFGFESIRDDRTVFPPDRVEHLNDILTWMQTGGTVSGAADRVPAKTTLAQNYPNPFNPTTTIVYTVARRGRVNLRIYDVAGRLVRTLVDADRDPGVRYDVTWDGRNGAGQQVSSGVYFYRLTTPGYSGTRKMVLLK